MKKINLILAMLVAATVSCTKEEAMEPSQQEGKYTIMLDGVSAPATKLDMLKDEHNYNLNWSTADKIKLYSTSINGVEAGFTEYAEGDKGRALFQTNATVNGLEELVVVYPSSLTYANGKVTGNIPAIQAQGIADGQDPITKPRGSAFHLGQNTLAYGKTTIDPSLAVDNVIPVSFAISQKAAFVMVELVATDEFAGYELVGAKLYAKGEKLAGSVTYDPATEAVTVADAGASDVVGVEYKAPQALVKDGKYDLYFVSAPRAADATGDLTLIVTLKKGYETVTLPHKLPDGFKIESGKVSYITLPISLVINSYEWFEPVDVRDMVGGWAYGPQNTYYVESGETANLEVKARGEFTKVVKPAKCGILLGAYPATTEPITTTTEINTADWTIGVTASGTTSWGIVAIYDDTDKVLWSYFICRYNSGDAPKDITYTSDLVVMDRVLGQVEGNEVAINNKTFNGNIPYFQWGKKDPIPWSNTGLTDWYKEQATTATDLETTISNPTVQYCKGANDFSWMGTTVDSALWGGIATTSNYEETNKGHKTIYDPCPEGYRVPDPALFKELCNNCTIKELKLNNSNKIFETGNAANSNQLIWKQYVGSSGIER